MKPMPADPGFEILRQVSAELVMLASFRGDGSHPSFSDVRPRARGAAVGPASRLPIPALPYFLT